MSFVDDHGFVREPIDVFISYNQGDAGKVAIIAELLKREGLHVFWDKEIPAGVSYTDFIGRMLDLSRTVLVCWSPAAVQSEWVVSEAEYARDRKLLVACVLEPCAPRPPFNTFQRVDLSGWDGATDAESWRSIVELIKHRRDVALRAESAMTSPPETQPAQTRSAPEPKPKSSVLKRVRSIWPVLTLIASGALLAGAHAFERLGGLAPCPLCLMQRDWHWGVVGASILMLILQRTPFNRPRLATLVLGLILLGSFARAAFHVGVEEGVFTYVCAAAPVDLDDLSFDVNAALEVPSCDEPAWTLLGISMAGYNALISLVLALASFAAALWPERKS